MFHNLNGYEINICSTIKNKLGKMNSSFVNNVQHQSQIYDKILKAKISTDKYRTNEKILFHKNTLLIYGPKLWYLIHFFAMISDSKKMENYTNSFLAFIQCVYELFPCPKCKNHFGENLKKYPIENYLPSRLLEWSCLIHNEVNTNNYKSIVPLDDCLKIYTNQQNQMLYFDNLMYILFTFATTYRIENFKYYKCLVVVFGNLIMDTQLQKLYIKALKTYPIDEYNQTYETIFRWVFLINTNINCNLNNPKLDYYNMKHFFLNVL